MYGYNDEQLQLLDYFYHSANILGDQEDTFARHHWMIDSGCIDHLLPFEDDFVHLGTQTRYATVANGQQVSMHGPGKNHSTINQRQDISNHDLTRSMVCTICSKSVTLCTHAY